MLPNLRRAFYKGSCYGHALMGSWEKVKPRLSPYFVQWMEENIGYETE
jgi:hypothetical protein